VNKKKDVSMLEVNETDGDKILSVDKLREKCINMEKKITYKT